MSFYLLVSGLEKRDVLVMVLIPYKEVPARFFSQAGSLTRTLPGCRLLLEMFVDTNNRVFFDCEHNTAQLRKIIDFIL